MNPFLNENESMSKRKWFVCEEKIVCIIKKNECVKEKTVALKGENSLYCKKKMNVLERKQFLYEEKTNQCQRENSLVLKRKSTVFSLKRIYFHQLYCRYPHWMWQ